VSVGSTTSTHRHAGDRRPWLPVESYCQRIRPDCRQVCTSIPEVENLLNRYQPASDRPSDQRVGQQIDGHATLVDDGSDELAASLNGR
jgi:hypothetical protein